MTVYPGACKEFLPGDVDAMLSCSCQRGKGYQLLVVLWNVYEHSKLVFWNAVTSEIFLCAGGKYTCAIFSGKLSPGMRGTPSVDWQTAGK